MNHISNIAKHTFDYLKAPAFLIALIVISALIPSFAYSKTRIEINPGIQIAHSYDDNIALEAENPKSDQITILSPRLLIGWHASQSDLEFEYAPNWMNYHTYTEGNELQHNGGLTFRHRWNKQLDFDFQDDFNTTDNFLDVPVVSNWHLPEARGVYYTNNTTAQLNYRFGQENSITAGYNYRFLINEDISLLSGNRAAAPDDTVRHGPFARLNYQFDIRNSLVLEYGYVRNLYKKSDRVISNQASDAALDSAEDDSVSDQEDDTDLDSAEDDQEEDEITSGGGGSASKSDDDISDNTASGGGGSASKSDDNLSDNTASGGGGSASKSDDNLSDNTASGGGGSAGKSDDNLSDNTASGGGGSASKSDDDLSDEEDDTEADDDEDAAPEPANDVESDRDFDEQTLTIRYIHRFNRHVECNLNQRIFIHRMIVSERSSDDYQVYDSTVGLNYQLSRHTGLSMEAGYSKQQGDPSHTSEGMLFNGSIDHQFKHGNMSLAVRNGWNADSPQESALEEDTGEFTRYWGLQGNINYQPWKNVQTYAGLFYRNDTSNSSVTSETWQANCGADIGLAPWLALTLNYDHQFRMEEQEEQTIDGDCTLNINALPWLVIGLKYQYRSNISDIPENQYAVNRFTLNLSAARTQPYFWNF